MTEKEAITSLSNVLTLSGGGGVNKQYINVIIQEDIPVLCLNREAKKKKLMPFKVLNDNKANFWQVQGGNWEYFVTNENIEKIKEKLAVKNPKSDLSNNALPKTEDNTKKTEGISAQQLDGFGKEYERYSEMTNEQRVECLGKDKLRLDELLSKKTKSNAEVTEALVDTAKDAALINHAALEEAMNLADDEAKKITQRMVDSTQEMVKSSAQLMQEDIFSNELMHVLVEKSKGTIVHHMTRVYLSGISFVNYYDKLVSTSSAIQKLRIIFPKKFRKLYHSLLPHVFIEDINLERVFYGGMRAISPELYFKWATGFLVHDIGKASAVEYHEGEGAYDRNIVIEHVKTGYKSITTKTNYPVEAGLITGYHHEYYGDSSGYGYFRAYLNQYKKLNPAAKQEYCITYDMESILDFRALAYFPAKILEIIDVYDSLTDPHRIYRKPLEPQEALILMQDEFIKKTIKIDPILFHIFELYIREKEMKIEKV